MDVFEAVNSRMACRWFHDKPVDLAIVKDLIVKSQRAASGGNLQSWYVYALANDQLKKFKRIVAERIANEDPRHIKSEYPIYPEPMFGAYKERPRGARRAALRLAGDRSEMMRRAAWRSTSSNFEFFDAPVALFIAIDRKLGPGQWADLGGYIHTLAYLARGYGLDTCPQEAWARLYDTVGEFIKLPPEQMLFCAVAIGYGDRKHKAND